MANNFKKTAILCVIGGLFYCLIEVMWRGYTHWSMFLVAALLSLPLDQINERLDWKTPLWLQSIYGAIGITIVELITGLIVNVWLRLNVWDYTHLPFNFFGQICLGYSALWVFLACFGIMLFDFLRWILFKERKPYYTWKLKRQPN